MSKRNQHIEDWLRQAAAQEPELSSDQMKQLAWGQLSNMLDKGEALPRPPRASGSGWWMILIEAMILVGSVTYMHTASIFVKEQDVIAINEKEHSAPSLMEEKYASDTVSSFINEGSALSSFKEDPYSLLGTAFASSTKELCPLSKTTTPFIKDHSVFSSIKKDLTSFNPALSILKAAKQKPASNEIRSSSKPTPSPKQKPTSKTSSSYVKRKQSYTGSSTGAVYWNTDPLEKDPSGQEQKRLPYAGHGSNTEAIHPLLTKQLFVPVKDSGVQHTPAPKTPRPHREKRERSPYSVKIAGILPIADAYGAVVSIEYTYQWKKAWYLRPYIGAEYLTGFNRVYDHISATVSENGGGPGLYKTDSVFTHFTLNGLFYGKAGIQAVYVFSKWEMTAGLEYRYMVNAFGKDTSKSVSIPGNTPPSQQQPILFNKKQITGSGNARLQLGIDYNLSRRLQIGADYYFQLNRKGLDSSYSFPHPKMPDLQSFQVHIRYFLPNL